MEELDVIEDDLTFEGHCSIDYGKFSNSQRGKKAKKLKSKATKRGWLYQR